MFKMGYVQRSETVALDPIATIRSFEDVIKIDVNDVPSNNVFRSIYGSNIINQFTNKASITAELDCRRQPLGRHPLHHDSGDYRLPELLPR